MRQTKLTLLGLFLSIIILPSCVYEEPIHVDTPDLDIQYEIFTGRESTLIEGEFFNAGNTFLNGTEIQIKFFDDEGFLVDFDWFQYDLQLQPGEVMRFQVDYPVGYVTRADVQIYDLY